MFRTDIYRAPGHRAGFRIEDRQDIGRLASSLRKDGIVDITRRQLGRLAAVGAGVLLLPGLPPPGRAAADAPPAGIYMAPCRHETVAPPYHYEADGRTGAPEGAARGS
ncbi:hypothetical protein C2142_36890 [Streptomyces sp. CB01881]|nr:hypothetical protein C2142_36890 [Streptomyces sp. CB01881]